MNDLQLEINKSREIIYIWWLCPLIKYEETDIMPEYYKTGRLVALLPKPPIPGVSYKLNEKKRWPIYINKNKRVICIGDPKIEGTAIPVKKKFADK